MLKNNKSKILPLFILIIIDSLGFWMIAPVLAPLILNYSQQTSALQLSPAMLYGILMALSPICYCLGAPLIGYYSDHYGRKRVLLWCLVATLIGFVVYSISFYINSLWLLIAARIISGTMSGSQAVAQAAMVDISNAQNKAQNIALIALALTIGLIIGPLMGGLLSDNHFGPLFNNTTPFIVASGLAILNILILQFGYQSVDHISPTLIHLSQHFKSLFTRKLYKLILAFFFFELGWSLYYQGIIYILLEHLHYSNRYIGFFSAYVGSCLSLGLLILVKPAVRCFKLPHLIQASLIIGTLALIANFLIPTTGLFWLTAIFVGFAVATTYSSLITLLSDRIEGENQGLLMGFSDSIIAIAFAITAVLAGLLSTWNSYSILLFVALFWLISAMTLRWAHRA